MTPVEEILDYGFRAPGLLETALAHPSYSHEKHGSRGNERLEFLGDAVLDLVVAELLYDAHPDWTEGHLTRARAHLVNTKSLARRARELGLPEHVKLGKTERRGGGADKDSILANVFEALVGALYLDGGLGPVHSFALRLFGADVSGEREPVAADPKTRFQEWSHAETQLTPRYGLLRDTGVENDDGRFTVEVRIGDDVYGKGSGRTKRLAERAAAKAALRGIDA